MELVFFALMAAVLVAVLLADRRRRGRTEEAYERLLTRERDLQPTLTPFDLQPEALTALGACLTEGHRNYGVEHGVQGPLATRVWDQQATLECATFRWWWEERHRNAQRGAPRYRRHATTVVVVRLPAPVPATVRIRPESAFGRLGLTRAGQQLESSEFNRRFRAEASDERLLVMLLDAEMQRLLADEYTGRAIEIIGDLLVLEGTPAHRDDSLAGPVGELPAARQDAARLVSSLPGQVWRQLGVGPDGPTSGQTPSARGRHVD